MDDFLDGAVIAKLKVGDVEGAQRFFDELAPRRLRSAGDLRSVLIRSYLGVFRGNID